MNAPGRRAADAGGTALETVAIQAAGQVVEHLSGLTTTCTNPQRTAHHGYQNYR